MISWQEEYKKKMVSAEEAVSHVKSGDRVVFTPGREALAIGLALASRKEELKGVRIFTASPSLISVGMTMAGRKILMSLLYAYRNLPGSS